ncbi:hypothetical protein ACSAZL_13745 [Methanosarcina sp. T3]|uniref:hypothetical protein n=1 Tax=Methanosarcina sp. T3 TaxID=3439062 RepID=UPI003F877B4A
MSEAKRAAYCRAANLPKQISCSRGEIRAAEPQICRNRSRAPEAKFGLQSRKSAETDLVLPRRNSGCRAANLPKQISCSRGEIRAAEPQICRDKNDTV